MPEEAVEANVADMKQEQDIGAYLQQLRTKQSIELNEAAQRTKYAVFQLEALEANNFELLPKDAALRGMVRNYGRYLGAEESTLLDMLGDIAAPPSFDSPTNEGATWSASEFTLEADTPRFAWGRWLLVVLVVVVVAVLWKQGVIPESWLSFDWLKKIIE